MFVSRGDSYLKGVWIQPNLRIRHAVIGDITSPELHAKITQNKRANVVLNFFPHSNILRQ